MASRVPILSKSKSRVPLLKPGQAVNNQPVNNNEPKINIVSAQPQPSLSVTPIKPQTLGPVGYIAPIKPKNQVMPSVQPIKIQGDSVPLQGTKSPTVQGSSPVLQPAITNRVPILSPSKLKVTGVDGTPAPIPTKEVPQWSDTAESSSPSLLPQTFVRVEKSPFELAWEDKSKTELIKDLVKAPIKDLIVMPGVRMGQLLNEIFPQTGIGEFKAAGSEQDMNINLGVFGNYNIDSQKPGLAGIKQIAGQGISAASWLYAPEKVVGIGKTIVSNAAIQAVKTGARTIGDAVVRDAFWNVVKQGVKTGAIVGSFGGLGTSLQGDGNWTDNAKDFVIGGLFGAALGGGGSALGASISIARNSTKFIQQQLEKELIARGVSPEAAKTISSQGGYLGKVLPEIPPKPASPQMRERGFLTSLKENPTTAEVFKDIEDLYERKPNSGTVERAVNLVNSDKNKAFELAYSQDYSDEANAVRVALIKDLIKNGEVEAARKLAPYVDIAGTESGRAVQIWRTLGDDLGNPAKALITAEKEIQKANERVMPKFEGKVQNVADEFQKVHKEVADKLAKEFSSKGELPPSPKTDLEKAIAKKQFTPEEMLAERIRVGQKTRKSDPAKDLINMLYKVAQELLPKKKKTVPKDEIELIGMLLREKDLTKDVWAKTQAIIRERYKDKPQYMQKLEDFFNKTFLSGNTPHADLPIASRSITKATQQEIRKQGINIGEIVRQHYTVVDKSGKTLTQKIVEKANVPFKEALTLAKQIQARFDELVKTKKDSILKSIFTERNIKKDKGFIDRVIEMSNLGAFDRVDLRDKLAEKLGLSTMTDDVAKKVVAQAEVVQQLPKGYERFKQTQELLKIISDNTPKSKAEIAGQVLNIPRTIMSSFDFSFGLRQGLVTAYSHPKQFWPTWLKSFKLFGSEKAYESMMDMVIKNPDFELARKAGVSFTDLGAKMGTREERFMSNYAEKIPIIGMGVRASARAYTGMANKLRIDVFQSFIKDAEKLGLNPRSNEAWLKDTAKLVNNFTGRGDLGKFEKAAPLLNAIFYSPRLMESRLSLLGISPFQGGPMYYLKAEPFVRKQALKGMLAYASATVTILGLAKLSGLEVGADPRSADFGKIKIGNTRIDILGGFQQYIRMGAQIVTGKYISSTTGKEYTLGEGYKPMTRLDIVMRQLQSKEAPVVSFITDWLRGTDYSGEKISIPKAVVQRLTPMVISDMTDLYNEDPELLPLGLLGTFGFGVQTYSQTNTSNASKGGLPSSKSKENKSTVTTKKSGPPSSR